MFETLAVSLAVVPFLTGQTTLALGVLVGWYSLQYLIAQRELTPRSVAIAIAGAIATVLLQIVVEAVRRAIKKVVSEINAQTSVVLRDLERLVATAVAVGFTLFAMGLLNRTMFSANPVGDLEVRTAAVTLQVLAVVVVALVAWGFATMRAYLGEAFALLPLADEAGVRRVLFAAETVWTLAGLLVALAFPRVGLAVTVLLFGALAALVLALRRLTRGSRVKCEACSGELHPAASRCPACHDERAPKAVGLWGRPLDRPAQPGQKHQLALLAARRCPSCASELAQDGGRVCCPACKLHPFDDVELASAFARYVDVRVAALSPAFLALGLVPVLGLVLALVLYRLSPAGALARYIGWRQRLGSRLLRGAILLGLALAQPIPVVGTAAALALVTVTQLWNRRAFLAGAAAGDVGRVEAAAA